MIAAAWQAAREVFRLIKFLSMPLGVRWPLKGNTALVGMEGYKERKGRTICYYCQLPATEVAYSITTGERYHVCATHARKMDSVQHGKNAGVNAGIM
jgi:hypothetical protein